MTLRSPQVVLGCCLVLPVLATGCGSQGTIAERLQDEDPYVRIDAIHDAARSNDRQLLPLLVERLSDSEAEVRFFAYLALRRRTGETFGYRYYAPRVERFEAVERWRAHLRRNNLVADANAPTDANGTVTQKENRR